MATGAIEIIGYGESSLMSFADALLLGNGGGDVRVLLKNEPEDLSMPPMFSSVFGGGKRERGEEEEEEGEATDPSPKKERKKKVKDDVCQSGVMAKYFPRENSANPRDPEISFLSNAPLVQAKASWFKNDKEETKSPKNLPNKKFACSQYTAEFVDWTLAAAHRIVEIRPLYQLVIDEERDSSDLKIPAAAAETVVPDQSLVKVPKDGRCMGCRRFFLTKDQRRCKEMAFIVCDCGKRRAAYCVQCKVIQWADGEKDEYGRVECLGARCKTRWDLQDICIVKASVKTRPESLE